MRAAVRDRYAQAAEQQLAAPPGGGGTGCCDPGTQHDPITRQLYDDDAHQTSAGALAASLGCGNPTMLAQLKPGDRVLDLGSGGGLDVLLSARRVAPDGVAYGLDMTPQMLELARRNQQQAGVRNAVFLQGTIEQIPMQDESVDVVISNCVINLAADKDAVLREAFRVLKPGGRFAVSDIVLTRALTDDLAGVVALWTGCVAGALVDADYLQKLTAAGFAEAEVDVTRRYERQDLVDLAESLRPDELPTDIAGLVEALDGAFVSAFVRATKPGG